MPHNESFELAGPAGALEALLMVPEEAPRFAALVCHAHPLHGGVMHFKVVFRAAKQLQQHGAAVLRFNFRGVGTSAGQHDHGRGEQDDVRAGLDELERRFPGLPIVLGGFSFGSAMALRVGVADARVRALFALGFPIRIAPDVEYLSGCTKPRLFVQGEHDSFGNAAEIAALVAPLPEPKHLDVIPESDHFFTGKLDELAGALHAWLATRRWESA